MKEAIIELRDLGRAFCDELKAFWGDNLVSVVLYGSVARGDGDKDSDVDLLIVGEELPRSISARHDLVRPAFEALRDRMEELRERGYNADITWIVKTKAEAAHRSPLYLDMTEDAIVLYDKDGFFKGVLDGMRKRMEELGSRRVWLDNGRWYWDLKPDYRYPERFEI
jgi:hypothetical protein